MRCDLELFEIACSNADWLEQAADETRSKANTVLIEVQSKNNSSLRIEGAQKNDFFGELANQMRTLYVRARAVQRGRDSASPEKRADGATPSETSTEAEKRPKVSVASEERETERLLDGRERSVSESEQRPNEALTGVAFEMKQLVEHARLRIAQDLNTLKRLLALAETSYPDLYRCYQFVRRSSNRDVLCEHVRRYASLYSEEAMQLIELFDECIAIPRLVSAESS